MMFRFAVAALLFIGLIAPALSGPPPNLPCAGQDQHWLCPDAGEALCSLCAPTIEVKCHPQAILAKECVMAATPVLSSRMRPMHDGRWDGQKLAGIERPPKLFLS